MTPSLEEMRVALRKARAGRKLTAYDAAALAFVERVVDDVQRESVINFLRGADGPEPIGILGDVHE